MLETVIMSAGYEGESLSSFLGKLESAGVDVLVDVRTFAFSHKRGFSKSALRAALGSVGIEYTHLPGLGMPRDLLKYRATLTDNQPILDAYDRLLPTREVEIGELLGVVAGKRACLLCLEADESQCHRSRLIAYLRTRRPGLAFRPLAECVRDQIPAGSRSPQ